MSQSNKSYQINSCELLQPSGDASKFLVRYVTYDDDQCTNNQKKASIEIILSRSAITSAKLNDNVEQAKVVISFLKGRIENAMKKGNDIPSEMLISIDDLPAIPNRDELNIGVCHTVTIERKMGFLSP